jgi:tetratricopeptide (TPR) repeat protein
LPLVGRDVELRLVLSLFEATVEDSAPKLGLLEAPAGAGKTRLLHEAVKQIAASEPQPTVWHIQADSVLGNTPRALARTLIRAALSDPPAVPSRTIGDRHDAELLQLAHQLGLDASGASLRTARFVGALAGLIAQADEIELADLRARGDVYDRELAREFERWLSIVAKAAPLVLVLEDLHCADEASLQLIVSSVARLTHSPITVIGSARPEASVVEPFRAAGAQRIGLTPLTRRAALRLAQALPSLDEATVTRLWEKSGGSPLFLEELFRQADARDSDLPSSLSAAVEEDLALLSNEAASLARLASMLGNQVQLGDLMALVSGRDQLSVETALDELHRRDVLRLRLSNSAAGQLTFRHPLWRELTEATLSLQELAETRHQIVRLWSERDPASAARQAELEAETWGKLEHPGEQREAWAQAGLLWQAAGDLERTIDAFDKAMLGSGGRWLVALGKAVAVLRRSPPGLVERLEVELERSQQQLDGLSWVGAARCFAALSRGSAAKDCLDRALALEQALPATDEQRMLRRLRLAASVEVGNRRGAFGEAAAAYRELARGDERIDVRTRVLASLALAASGHPAEAEEVLRETALLPEADERSVKAEISKNLLLTKLFAKDYAGAVPVADQAIADARLARLPFHEAVALHNFGDVLHRLERYADSRAALRTSQELAETHQFEALMRANRSHLRYLDGLDGDAQAVLALEREIADAESRGALGDAVDLRCLIARVFRKHEQLERAAIEYDAVLRLSRSTGQKLAHEEAENALAQLKTAANAPDRTQPDPPS